MLDLCHTIRQIIRRKDAIKGSILKKRKREGRDLACKTSLLYHQELSKEIKGSLKGQEKLNSWENLQIKIKVHFK
jgi:hypothetical protein